MVSAKHASNRIMRTIDVAGNVESLISRSDATELNKYLVKRGEAFKTSKKQNEEDESQKTKQNKITRNKSEKHKQSCGKIKYHGMSATSEMNASKRSSSLRRRPSITLRNTTPNATKTSRYATPYTTNTVSAKPRLHDGPVSERNWNEIWHKSRQKNDFRDCARIQRECRLNGYTPRV